jgi:CRP/FNR family cyclic AMP-dependent transcriptional regulator
MSDQPNLALKTIQNLAQDHPVEIHPPGDIIFRADEAGDCIYAIIEGTVQVDWGKDVFELLHPGCCFGFDVLIDAARRRYCSATAVDSVKLLSLDRERFLLAIQEFPMFALETLHIMDERLRGVKTR